MTGTEVAKQLALAFLLVFVVGLGAMLLPPESRYLRAAFSITAALVLAGYLVFAKPRATWVKSTLVILSSGLAFIGVLLALGG